MKKRRLQICCVSMALLTVVGLGLFYRRAVRQQRLDRALIQAIQKKQDTVAIGLLAQGADANATVQPTTSLTLRRYVADLVHRLKHNTPSSENQHAPALMLVYGQVYFGIPDTSIYTVLNLENATLDDLISSDLTRSRDGPHGPLIAALLAHGARLDMRENEGVDLLAFAAIRKDAQAVKALLQRHVDPNGIGQSGYPALSCTDDYECARLLLEFGADPNRQDARIQPRLMFVRNTQLYPLLWEHHADLNVRRGDGQTPLIHLFRSRYLTDAEIRFGVRFLLDHGAKVALKDNQSKSALEYARGRRNYWVYGSPGDHDGRYDKEILLLLQTALRKEQAQK